MKEILNNSIEEYIKLLKTSTIIFVDLKLLYKANLYKVYNKDILSNGRNNKLFLPTDIYMKLKRIEEEIQNFSNTKYYKSKEEIIKKYQSL